MSDRTKVHSAIARSLREFGYSDVTPEMIAEVDAAMKSGDPLPHGIVGLFAQKQLREYDEVAEGAA